MAVQPSPQNVLEKLMNDGIFDDLRVKLLSELKQNEELKLYTSKLVEQSAALAAPNSERKNRRDLFEALRSELEAPVLEKASAAAWELILSDQGVGQEIVEKVEDVYCQLYAAAFPQPLDSAAAPVPPGASSGPSNHIAQQRNSSAPDAGLVWGGGE